MRIEEMKLVFMVLIAILTAPAFAQPYPVKPIRVIVAQAPGSANDLVARIVSNKLADSLGKKMVVDTHQ